MFSASCGGGVHVRLGPPGMKVEKCWLQDGCLQKMGLDRGNNPNASERSECVSAFFEIISGLSPIFGETSSWCLERRHIENVISFLPFRGSSLHFPKNHQSESKTFSKLRTFELPGRFHQKREWIFEVPKFEANQYLATGRWVGGDRRMLTFICIHTYLPAYTHPSIQHTIGCVHTYVPNGINYMVLFQKWCYLCCYWFCLISHVCAFQGM